ncbi:MAG: N-acylglucosamine 2-epimerase, partial [Chlorobi bacterium]|nr:N-acylglucosamine 2-epimerase [Chlorobiota bacterium]
SWSLELGWDDEYEGLFAFVDIEGKPSERLEWDMKLWWPHTEALYATLLAYRMTNDHQYWTWFEKIHSYAFARFPDTDHGEWFGYLHRDGSIANSLKGSMWKGMFHVPRALLNIRSLLREMYGEELT